MMAFCVAPIVKALPNLYVPAGNTTVPPVEGTAFIAFCMAFLSSVEPSPVAP